MRPSLIVSVNEFHVGPSSKGENVMPENDLVVEFKKFLEDPVQQSWIQVYLDGDQEAETLVEAALRTLEGSYGIEED
jgi:hypothetical protein